MTMSFAFDAFVCARPSTYTRVPALSLTVLTRPDESATFTSSPSLMALAATVYHCLGVDPQTTIRDKLNRPLAVCDGEPIRAIL